MLQHGLAPGNIILSERSQTQKVLSWSDSIYIKWSELTENKQVAARVLQGRRNGATAKCRGFFLSNENVLKLDTDDGCTTL